MTTIRLFFLSMLFLNTIALSVIRIIVEIAQYILYTIKEHHSFTSRMDYSNQL
jgi:hypothetical protein